MENTQKTAGKTAQIKENKRNFLVSFEFETTEFAFASGLENELKRVFPQWKNIHVETEAN